MTTRRCPRCGHDYPTPRDPRAELLATTLEVSVFFAIEECRRLPLDEVIASARAHAGVIAAHGDDLQYGGKHCAGAHAAVARGLAALAFAPGGVDFLGAHWCAEHPDRRRGAEGNGGG